MNVAALIEALAYMLAIYAFGYWLLFKRFPEENGGNGEEQSP